MDHVLEVYRCTDIPIHIVSVADIEISTISVGANIVAKNRYDTPIYN